MRLQRSHSTLWLLSCVAMLSWTLPLMAANLTVDNTNPSSVSATSSQGTNSTPITAQGTFGASSGLIGETDYSQANVVLNDSGNTLTLGQSDPIQVVFVAQPAVTPVGTTDSGAENLFFKVATNTGFDLTGSYSTIVVLSSVSPASVPQGTTSLSASLYDVTTSSTVFNENKNGSAFTLLTLDPETGTLTAGDLYQFQASAAIFVPSAVDPNGSGTVSFGLTPGVVTPPNGGQPAPLPSAVCSGLAALLLAAAVQWRLRRQPAPNGK